MLRARADSGLVFRASGDEATPGLEYNSFMGQQATNTSVGQEQEDRDLFGFDKVAKVLVPRFKQLQGLPRIDESVKDAFETLGLNSMPISRDEIIREHLVTKFFSCREFNRWAKHVARTNKQDRYAAMFDVLQATFNEKNVATLIILAKDSWRTQAWREAGDGAVRVVVLARIRVRLYSDEYL
uniref:RxLR effector candidate protein n=2 Tax=Hyaloperonospora arabidopsidis (strain Emoy2) TaxID=559515 RepID=M4BXX2_HYAAE